ncbi:F-box/LRR-repeat protein At4g14096-like [Chenopodium quinoa]|uniref:F-box/LRR-repeat protein 15/At3g58940/PEG3-like LRR domain-containing protein n=1 Tax=Chenopodium quinoa TaxID=63459 RepID=A0A803KSP2_CHEQI|nr:F-box/LRR-repeat protein At4g14096-like [Chenopodium quinoa]
MTCKQTKLEDRLSALPDSLLCHILSFLPTNEAVQTVLIRRFGTLWTFLQNIDFDDALLSHLWANEDINSGFFRFVHNALKLHQRPTVDRFRVNISTMLYEEIPSFQSENWGCEIDSWLTFALRKQVKFLEFGFGMVEPVNEVYKLPFIEFISDSLVELKLVFIEMKLQKRVKMGSLRVLKLDYMSLNDDVFKEIIQGCPLLKELEISNCFDPWDFTEINAPNLDILKLDREIGADSEQIMKINCPKLSSFNYSGCVEGLEIVNLSSLAEFSFVITWNAFATRFNEFTRFQSVLTKVLHVKNVSISDTFVTVLFYCMLKCSLQEIVQWKRVDLKISLTDKHIFALCHLLTKSPNLEELVLNVVPSCDLVKEVESELESCNPGKEEEYCWSSLKTIVIHNISMSLYPVVHLVEILLRSSPALDEMMIYYKASNEYSAMLTSEQLAEFSEKLPTFRKASQTAKVILL